MDEPLGALDKQLREHMQIELGDRLYEPPTNRFVANFVGDNAVLEAKVHATDGEECVVALKDGTRLRGLNVNRATVGDAVQCSVRPERIQLADGESGNTLSGTVMDVIYFCDHLRLRCKMASEAEVMVKLSLNHHAVPTPGHTVQLHAPAQHMRVYL